MRSETIQVERKLGQVLQISGQRAECATLTRQEFARAVVGFGSEVSTGTAVKSRVSAALGSEARSLLTTPWQFDLRVGFSAKTDRVGWAGFSDGPVTRCSTTRIAHEHVIDLAVGSVWSAHFPVYTWHLRRLTASTNKRATKMKVILRAYCALAMSCDSAIALKRARLHVNGIGTTRATKHNPSSNKRPKAS